MADHGGGGPVHLWRRGSVAVLYAVLALGLLRALARDQPWVAESIEALGAVFPNLVVDALGPTAITLGGFGMLLLVLAMGSFVVARESGGAFAMLVVVTVAWFVFPYAQVPWAALLAGGALSPARAPLPVWVWGGSLVFLATFEVLASARGHMVEALTEVDRSPRPGATLRAWSRSSLAWVLGVSLVVGTGFSIAYVRLRGMVQLPVWDLLWVPVALGAALALTLWFVARERPL